MNRGSSDSQWHELWKHIHYDALFVDVENFRGWICKGRLDNISTTEWRAGKKTRWDLTEIQP